MNNISITLDVASVTKFFKEIPENLERAIATTIQKATLLIERDAKIGAPVDTGRLRSSISSEIRPLSSTVSTHTNYARYVHDGTRFMRARPFMANAGKSAVSEMETILGEEIAAALQK